MELRIVFICVFISVLDQSDGQDLRSPAAAPLDSGRLQPAAKASLIPSVCRKAQNVSSSLSVEIQLPFMDMELHHEGRLHVLQDEQLLLVLHGHELFQWHIAGEDKRLVRLGQLEGRVRQQLSAAVAAAVVLWHEDLLFAVALPDTLEFYQLPQEQLMNSTQWHLLPIQEFSLPGKLHQLQLLKTKLDQVVLLLTVNSTQTQSKCITFEWLDTYFNPVSELNLPALEAFQLVGHQPYYIITGRSLRTQSALVLTVYELETPSLRLRRRQSLTVHARHVRTTRFRGRNHLIACGRNATASCLLFRMVDGNFVVYRKHMLQQLHFTHLASSPRGQLLAATRGNGEVLVFNSHRFDCYSGFGADPNPSGVYVHRNPLNETFLMLAYQRQSNVTLLRMVQLGGSNDTAGNSLDGSDDLSSVQVHRHEFEESINALRSLLLRRKQKVDALHRLTLSMKTKQKELHLGSGSHVEQVHVQGEHLQTPMQLKHRLEQLRQHYAVNRRPVRSFGVGNDSSSMGQEVLKVRRLHVRNLIYNGELMPNYYVDNSSSPILTIKGKLLTNKLQTQQLLTPQSYKRPSRAIDPLQQVGQGNLVVRQLHVARINNVSWFDFYDSLFLQSRDNLIEGRLIVQSRARVVNLETPLLNGLVVDQLFNLRQPQLVSSNIFMSAFFVSKLEAKLINGLDFANDIVFRGDNATLIKTPVHIYQMNVSGDLLVANDTKWTRNRTPETETEGSLEHRLQQYYTGSVILNGSLTVKNVVRDTNATQLLLGEQSLRQQDLHKDYLLLQGEQQLAALMFGNAKVTTSQLNSNHIDGHPVAEHLLDAEQQLMNETIAKPLHIIFMDARIEGDLHCSNYTTRLAQIAKDAVRQGETAIITGHKQFEAELIVETLHSKKLNGIDIADEFVLKSQPMQNFNHLKSFERIVVKQQAAIGDDLTVQELNSLPMAQLMQRGYSLQRLELATATTPQLQHLQFQRLNNLAFDELLGLLSVNEEQQQLLLHKQLIIEGNVRFEQPLQLHTINGIQWDSYVQRLVNSQTNALIEGQKIFGEPVLLTDALQAPSINGLDLSALLDNTLLRSTPQSISGNYNFGRITVGNLDVPAVNEVPASSFIDTRQKQPLQLRGNLYVQQLSINGSLSCQLPNDPLPQLDTQLVAMQQRQWRNIWVLGDALWQQSDAEQPQLDYLRQHAVRRRGGATQTISGQVTLKQPQFNKLQTLQSFPTSLNLTHIAADALLRQSNATQIVSAPQVFVQQVQAGVVRTLDDCHVQQLNEFDPTRLNASLYRRSSGQPIAAQLRFDQPPDVKRLSVEGRLNGGDLAGIFEQSATAVWPAVQLQQLQVQQHLQLDEINGMHLEYLLQNRVPLRSSQPLELFGTLSFEQLELGANIRLRSINGIALSQVVYKHGERLQAISGAKTFDGGIVLHGPAHVMQLNGRDLSDSYQQSIFTDRDYSIDSLRLDGATFEAGLLPLVEQQARQAVAGEELLPQQLQQLEQQLKISQAQHTQRLRYLDYEPQVYATIWNASESATNDNDVEAAIVPQQPLLSSCQQQELRARLSRAKQRVLISQEQRVLHATAQQGALHVQAENNCHASKLKSKLRSRIHITCRGEQHTLGMRQHVRQLQLLELPPQFSGNNLLLLLGTLEEVRVLHVNMANCSLSDWQSLPHAAAQLMQVLQLPDAGGTFLLTAALPAPELPTLAVHRLVTASQRFELLQLIEGDFDLAELQQLQLFLSCRRCRRIDVHEFDAELQRFRPLQQLRLEARVQQLLPFGVGQEQHLLVLTLGGSSNFYLLSYTHLGAWQSHTYGQMGDVLWSWPLIQPGEQLRRSTAVLLLCGELQCNEVSALLD